MEGSKKRNTSIDFFRFFFMILICIHHYGGMKPELIHGYIGVEFFFIVSGVFLYKSFVKTPNQTLVGYLAGRLKRLWGEYFVALLFFWAVYLVWQIMRGVDFSMADYAARLVPDALLLQGTGLFGPCLNSPTWYVSTLLIVSVIVFCLLKLSKKISLNAILPLGFVLGYVFLAMDGSFDVYYGFKWGLFTPSIRAFAGISAGVLLCNWTDRLNGLSVNATHMLDILAIVSFVMIVLLMFSDCVIGEVNRTDSIMLMFILILVFDCLNANSMLQKFFGSGLWISLGGVSYEMLLLHAPIMIIVNFFRKMAPLSDQVWLVVYLVIVVIASYIFKYIYQIASDSVKSCLIKSKPMLK